MGQHPVDTPLISHDVDKAGDGTGGPRFNFVIAACARWEKNDIVEWIEYRRMIGFDHIYVYSRDTSDTYLASYWLRKAGRAYDFRPRSSPGEGMYEQLNVAFRKPSQQSSVDHEAARTSPVAAYALGHGNDGIRRGSFGFHTLGEDRPWWSVDLIDQFLISEIRLYNRVETPELADRSRYIAVEIKASDDWKEIVALDGRSTFGGVNRNDPLIVKLDPPQLARHVRIVSRRPTILHLDEVEVYGVSPSRA